MTSKPTVIALTGKARAGKDTVAQYIGALVQQYNDHPQVEHEDSYVVGAEALAAPIKSMVAMMLDFFGLGRIMEPVTLQPYIDGDKKEEVLPGIGKSARQLMQTLGTEWGRDHIDVDVWLNCMTARIHQYDDAVTHGYKGSFVIVTDARFDNEAQALKDRHDAIVVQVVRDDAPDQVGEGDHTSELGISPALIDYTIKNNGDMEALLDEVYTVLKDVLPEMPEEVEDDAEPDDEG